MGREDRLLVRVAEAADLLSISRSKAYQLIADGKLPALKVGSSLRVPVQQLEEWIELQSGELEAEVKGE